MTRNKKPKKVKQPLWLSVIKIIVIALGGAILLAGIAERIIHLHRHLAK